jgi:hypothetical protein
MSNSGNRKSEATIGVENSPEDSSPLLRQRVYLLVAAIVLLFAVFIGIQLFGIIYGLVFPPDAPVPGDVVLIEHDNYAYGVDEWLYGTGMDACDVVTFYLENGADCRITPGQCGIGMTNPMGSSVQNIATCTGAMEFSIFNMSWETTIATGYPTGDPTRFRVRREVFWIGSASDASER